MRSGGNSCGMACNEKFWLGPVPNISQKYGLDLGALTPLWDGQYRFFAAEFWHPTPGPFGRVAHFCKGCIHQDQFIPQTVTTKTTKIGFGWFWQQFVADKYPHCFLTHFFGNAGCQHQVSCRRIASQPVPLEGAKLGLAIGYPQSGEVATDLQEVCKSSSNVFSGQVPSKKQTKKPGHANKTVNCSPEKEA